MRPRAGRRTAPAAASLVLLALACSPDESRRERGGGAAVAELVRRHARAWETGDTALLRSILHPEARLAHPRRRLGAEEWIREMARFARRHVNTRVYVHEVIVEGSDFAVEWQFATTERETGLRTAVSDAIIGRVLDGRIVEWREYLDGRVPELQKQGRLPLDEGGEPHPWPRSSR